MVVFGHTHSLLVERGAWSDDSTKPPVLHYKTSYMLNLTLAPGIYVLFSPLHQAPMLCAGGSLIILILDNLVKISYSAEKPTGCEITWVASMLESAYHPRAEVD